MTFKVQVGPPQISIHQGQTVLVTQPDGGITSASEKGLYFFDTRLVSSWSLHANGIPWDLINGGPVSYDAARIHLSNRAFNSESGHVPGRTLALVLTRALDGGMHEDLDVTNYGLEPVRFNLEIAIRCDFADLFEVKSGRIVRRGRIATEWSETEQSLASTYRNGDFARGVTVQARPSEGRAAYANGRLSFALELAPGASWHCCLLYDMIDGNRKSAAAEQCEHERTPSDHSRALNEWRQSVTSISTSNEEFYRFFHQAVDDMAALRLPIGGTDATSFVPAAGLPWFVALFGRDSLLVSLQNMLIYPEFAYGTLKVLGDLQATERDDYRDAEPGKILHELRYGELAHFKLIPHTPYYGTADATPLYLITLHEAWKWTGDEALLRRHLRTAEACLAWIDEHGDRDGDGFQEYQTRSSAGYENMAWKDAGDSVPYLDGTLVKGPKALCELQGYVYDAWVRMAEAFDALGRFDRATELRRKAEALFARFNAAFWDEDGGFYAYCLDGEKRPVFTVASNPGHCLWSGIVPPDRARRVVERLMAPDMLSGWGIRTLSAEHPSFNPYSYQNGSVWPHDNAIIALGFRRYGFVAEALTVARQISGAAGHFLLNQLPELYAGTPRGPSGFPVQYVGANVPQAWAAGSAFMIVHAILGLQPGVPPGKLGIDPVLPDWLPDVTLLGLRLGGNAFDIRFWREGEETRHEVLRGDPAAVVRCAWT